MEQPQEQPLSSVELDPIFKQQVQKLYNLILYGRWLVVAFLWLSVGALSLWGLRSEIALWLQYFTWVAVKFALYYNPLPTIGLTVCVVMTISVIIWQSRNILLGLPPEEQRRLEQQVQKIRQQGATHPLWKWICQ
ncbi:MAG TPA: hypothetical protein V6D09_22515 [Leptolyngbyaceae cyanobacterium]